MKNLAFLPLLVMSSCVFAQAQGLPSSDAAQTSAQAAATDSAVPLQLSFEAQQARAAELAKQAEEAALAVEQQRQAEMLEKARARVMQEIGGNTLLLTAATSRVYADNDFQPMWQDNEAVRHFLREYALFAASGVSAKSAHALQQILNSQAGLARDILLTDAFLDYVYYAKNVSKQADQWLYRLGSYTPKSPTVEQIQRWTTAVNKGESLAFISSLTPSNHIYQETVAKLFAMTNGNTAPNKDKPKKGKTNAEGNAKSVAKEREMFAKLAINAQRLRLIPSFDNGIFVNIPSYQLYYFRHGELALQSKVIVGRDDRRTPVMYSKLSNVVVNPPWNVPPTIKAQDLVPKFSRNPGMVESSGYEILDGSGKKMNPHSINWKQYVGKEKSFPYHIRQKPGDNAALGLYKFNMPSSDAIYLHDTPNRGLFGKSQRALSSGCVRVAKSDELATLLLKEAGWTDEKKKSVLESRKTTSAPIKSDNPVYLYYVTAWVEGGKMHTLPDVYKYDTNLPRMNIDWQKLNPLL